MNHDVIEADGVRARVLRGVAWKAGSQLVLQISRFGVAIVLARLLAPHEWGLAAMVVVLSGAIILFGDSALGTALIQRRSISDADRSTVFWTAVAVGLVLTLVGVALSGPVAGFYGEDKVRPLFAVLSLSFIITSLGSTQTALLLRDMDFRHLELRRIAATFAGGAVGIFLALKGFGAWAIVGQQLAIAGVQTVLVWRFVAWRPSATFSLASLKSLGAFTGNVFGQNFLYYIARNIDNILVGRYLGAAALGAYGLAYNVILAPFNQITGPLQEVMFPAFSRLQDEPRRLADAWIRVTRLVAAISMPALVGLVIVAPDFVSTVLGPRWSAATRVIQILAWVGLIQSLQHLNGEILYALDRSRTFFRFTIVWAIGTVAAFAIGLHWGILGVATCFAISSTLIEPANAWLTARALDMSVWTFLRSLGGVVQASALMGLSVLGARSLLVLGGVPAAARLPLLVLFGAAVFVPACSWRAPEVRSEIAGVLRARRPREPEAPLETPVPAV